MPTLLSVQEARTKILAALEPLPVIEIPLTSAYYRTLAEDISSPFDLPPFSNSSVDGYAVRSGDISEASQQSPVTLKLIGEVTPGSVPSTPILSGQCMRIMTGSPLPPGSDTVVPVEDTDQQRFQVDQPYKDQVEVYLASKPGNNIRPAGQDVRKGQHILSKGNRLLSHQIALLASLGIFTIPVYRKPNVAIISTGDELIKPGRPIHPGQIYESNSFALRGLVEDAGAEIVFIDTVPDQPKAVDSAFKLAQKAGADLIISSAGVSVGAHDYVRYILEQKGEINFWRVNMRPGKPLAFGNYQRIPVIGLPGNPVSSFVGCLVFVLPAIARLSGMSSLPKPTLSAILAEPIESDGRESYLRARVEIKNGQVFASLPSHQGSGNLYSLVTANALLIIPSGVKSLPAGSSVDYWSL